MRASSPLLPATADDAKALFGLISEHIAESVGWLDVAVQSLALECVLHGVRAAHGILPKVPRAVVLHGADPLALLNAARAAAASTFFPTAEMALHTMSEMNWYGQSLSDMVSKLSDLNWCDRAIIFLAGLDSLCVRHGTYTGTYGTTRDYKEGKGEDVAGLLAGHIIPSSRTRWTANGSLIIFTAPLQERLDVAGLRDWGLSAFLSELLGRATWIRIESAAAVMSPAAVRHQLEDTERAAKLIGLDLCVTTESINWTLMQAAHRGETAATAACWIVESTKAALINTLRGGPGGESIVLGPDDITFPPSSRPQWRD